MLISFILFLNRFFRNSIKLPLNIIYVLSHFFPRNPKLCLFGAWGGKKYNDNTRYIYEYISREAPWITSAWITKNKKLATTLRSEGKNAFYYLSISGLYYQIKASMVVFTHSADNEFFAPFLSRDVLRVQTWHGSPLKKIGYDDVHGVTRRKSQFIESIFPFRSDHIDLAFASSQYDKDCFTSAFGMDKKKIVITGYARNDLLTDNNIQKNEGLIKTIYLPTLRGKPGEEFNLFETTKFDFVKYDELLKIYGISLDIQVHPVQKISDKTLRIIKNCNRIRYLTTSQSSEFYRDLKNYDLLITDYSGVYIDFLLTFKPVILAPFDLQEYEEKDRELYLKYSDLCIGELCVSWEDMFLRIKKEHEQYKKKGPSSKHISLTKQFHKFLDNQSTSRCAQEIEKLLIYRGDIDQFKRRRGK